MMGSRHSPDDTPWRPSPLAVRGIPRPAPDRLTMRTVARIERSARIYRYLSTWVQVFPLLGTGTYRRSDTTPEICCNLGRGGSLHTGCLPRIELMRNTTLTFTLFALVSIGVTSLATGLFGLVRGRRSAAGRRPAPRSRNQATDRVRLPTNVEGVVLDASKPVALIILGTVCLYGAGSLATGASDPAPTSATGDGQPTTAAFPTTVPHLPGLVTPTPTADVRPSVTPSTAARTDVAAGSTEHAATKASEVTTVQTTPRSTPAKTTSAAPVPARPGPAASITTPRAGALVGACAIVKGTSANLPANTTLITIKHKPNAKYWPERPTGWQSPSALTRWTDTQYFEDTANESFGISIYLAPLSDVQNVADSLTSIPTTWRKLDEVFVVANSSTGKREC